MSIEDVDKLPYLIMNSKQEEIVVNKEFNSRINNQITKDLKYSKVLRKISNKGYSMILSLYVSKTGELDAIVIKANAPKEVQEEFFKILRAINNFVAANHEGKEVVVSLNATLPVYF